MSLNVLKTICLIGLIGSLSACSYFYGEKGIVKDSSYQYLNAKQGKPLKLPVGLHHQASIDYFPVPVIDESGPLLLVGRDVRLAAPTQLLDIRDNVRINKRTDNPAVFINEEQEFVWKTILKLFEQNNIALLVNEHSDHQSMIVTDWVAVDEKGVWLGVAGSDEVDDFRAKYRVTLTQGQLPGENQVGVERLAAEKWDDDTDLWQSVPIFWRDSAEMLNLIIANYDILAAEKEAEARKAAIAGFEVQLAKDDNDNAALLTPASIDVVWNKLPEVLNALSLNVYDKDRRSYTYFFRHDRKEQGFFASLFGFDEAPLLLEKGEYQVTVIALSEKTGIVFRDAEGAPLDTATLKSLFPVLRERFAVEP